MKRDKGPARAGVGRKLPPPPSALHDPELAVFTLFGDTNTCEIFELYTKQLGLKRFPIRSFRDLEILRAAPLPAKCLFVHDGCTPACLWGWILMILTHWHFRSQLAVVYGIASTETPCLPFDLSGHRKYEASHEGARRLLQEAASAVKTASLARRLPRVFVVGITSPSLNPAKNRLRNAARRLFSPGVDTL